MRSDLRSYTHILNLYQLRGDSVFGHLNDAVVAFKDDNAVDLKLNTEHHNIEIIFHESLSTLDCETIYKRLFEVKMIGVGLLTNRFDLFPKYELNYVKVSKLQDKMYKQKAKFEKTERKLKRMTGGLN